MKSADDNKALAGIKVVEFGQFIAGPGATQILADLGAEVIKIESANGDNSRRFGVSERSDYRSGMFMAYNRGKKSVTLDLRQPEGVAVARKLALEADVVVQNMRVGVMESLGLDAVTLRAEKPELIYASISGFGTGGPSRERPGLDIAAQAESGMMSLTGEPEGSPLKTGFAVVDAATAMAAANAILAALFRCARTGLGETIQTSLLAVAVGLQAQIWGEYACSGKLPERAGNAQPLVAPAADLIEVQDGHIVISAYLQDHWKRLCRALDLPEMIEDPLLCSSNQRVKNRPEMIARLQSALGRYTGEEARAQLQTYGVVCGVVRNYAQVRESADVEATGIFKRVTDGRGGEVEIPGLPFTLAEAPEQETPFVLPELGEHTVDVLLQAGFDPEQCRALQKQGVIGGVDVAAKALRTAGVIL